jgi:UDP-N-acetylmuramyl tripeptide synthase
MVGTASVRNRRYEPRELAKGFDTPGYVVEPDRRRAIALGLGSARHGDTVLVAGKGHETYQITEGRSIPFDDRIEAKKALDRMSGSQ